MPGVDYSVFVAEIDEGHVVNVAFTGLIDRTMLTGLQNILRFFWS